MKTTEIIVRCHPNHKPFSVPILLNWIVENGPKLQTSVYVHSDLKINDGERDILLDFLPKWETKSDLKLTLIWTSTVQDHMEILLNKKTLIGEVNLVKYLIYKLGLLPRNHLDESQLDEIHCVLRTKKLENWNFNQDFVAGKSFGVSDLVLYSHLKQVKEVPKEVTNWMNKCEKFLSGSPEQSQNGQIKTDSSGDSKATLFAFFKQNGIDFETIGKEENFLKILES